MSIRTTYTKKLEDGRIALRMAAVQIHGEYLIGEAIDCLAAYEALRRSPEELREILCAQEGCCPCCGNSERIEGARFCHICGVRLRRLPRRGRGRADIPVLRYAVFRHRVERRS